MDTSSHKGKKYEYKVGDVFGLKKIVGFYMRNNNTYVETECILCGKKLTIRPYELYHKKHQSCTCVNKTINGLHNSRIYRIYTNMKSRCLCETSQMYFRYGEKGIGICDEWLGENGFLNFYEWAQNNGYTDNMTIDRINNKGDYAPENCQWITKSENTARANKTCQHRRSNFGSYYIIFPNGRFFVFDNANKFVLENDIANEYGVNAHMITKNAMRSKTNVSKKSITKTGCQIGYANDIGISERDLNRLSKTPLINGKVSRVHAA